MNFVEVVRGGVRESRYVVSVAVTDETGRVVASVGDIAQLTFYRSAAKPFPALPLVEEAVADRLGMTDEELALVHVLRELEALGPGQLDDLATHGHPVVRNTRDEVVGEIRPAFKLEVPGSAGHPSSTAER
jgi:L-asparaginase II